MLHSGFYYRSLVCVCVGGGGGGGGEGERGGDWDLYGRYARNLDHLINQDQST